MTSILVVEDHAIVREPLARLLGFEGYRTLCAGNGNEAIAALTVNPVDLILLDLMMPRKDGGSFLEQLRADPRWRELPVIVLTGVIEGSQLDRARELGVQDILYKSRFTIADLFARIRERLRVEPAPATPASS
jgi:CheY-like chemotaxis protein